MMIGLLSSVSAIAQCKEIKAEAKVIKANEGKSTIQIEFKDNQSASRFQMNLFGPKRNNQLNTDKTTFEDLTAGEYLIVIVSKKEGDNYCSKSLKVTVN
ncbi:hypothetical protein WBG78_26545 [Chryseolinea sp. T2]